MYRVFVYGSLMRGFGNHRLIEDSTFVGDGIAVGSFGMRGLSAFPGAYPVPVSVGQPIVGELYEVDRDTMERLDALESNGRFYQRRRVPVRLDKGGTVTAWVYLLKHPERFGGAFVPNNDWRSHAGAFAR